MSFDENLAARVRRALGRRKGLSEKKMFGGIAFLLNGNMCCGVHKKDLIVRLEPDETAAALKRPGAREFDITGRPMKGWLLVGPGGVKGDDALARWVSTAAGFAGALPPK